MTDLILPQSLRQAKTSFRYIDSTGVTRGVYTGIPQTTNYGGDRIGATIEFTPTGGAQSSEKSLRAQLQAFFMSLRGMTNRAFLTDSSYTRRGSFPASEILASSDLSATTGWLAGSDASIAVADNALRVKRTANSSASAGNAYVGQSVSTLVAYAPYAWRFVCGTPRGNANVIASTGGNTIALASDSCAANDGYHVRPAYSIDATGTFYADNVGGLNSGAGDYYDLLFSSLSRCGLADSPTNLVLQSEDFSNGSWTKGGCTVPGANTDLAPFGSQTAETLQENSATTAHQLSQTVTVASAAADYTVQCYVKASNRSWCWLQMTETSGSTGVFTYFNLSGVALGASITTGANWANSRATITNVGNGWVLCTLTSRKTNAATGITVIVGSATGDGGATYLGTSTSSLAVYGFTLAQASHPVRYVATTTTSAAASSQSGTQLYVKGFPASATGTLLMGDQFEVDGQIKFLTASADTDASGRTMLQFSPPLRRAVADNTPIIVHKPMGRFMLGGDSSGWSNEPGVFSTAAIDLEEAFG